MWTLSLWDGFISKRRQVVPHALSLHHHLNGKNEALSPVLFLGGLSKFSGCAMPPTIVHYTVIPPLLLLKGPSLRMFAEGNWPITCCKKKPGFQPNLENVVFFQSVFGTNLTKPQRLVNGSQPNLVLHRLWKNLRPSNLHSLVGLAAGDGVIMSGIVWDLPPTGIRSV